MALTKKDIVDRIQSEFGYQLNRSVEITETSFRVAFKKRRCLILADGFYEWKGQKGQKQPIYLTLPDGNLFAFAGLWEIWDNKGKDETPYRSCTILTRESSESVMQIHDRMPVILQLDSYSSWLDLDNQDGDLLHDIIRSQVFTELTRVPVSKQVSSVKNNRPENIQPIHVT